MNQGEVDATFILDTGSYFDFKAKSPHENFLTLRWERTNDDDITVDFVYFGHHRNRIIYHAVRIEEMQECQ